MWDIPAPAPGDGDFSLFRGFFVDADSGAKLIWREESAVFVVRQVGSAVLTADVSVGEAGDVSFCSLMSSVLALVLD